MVSSFSNPGFPPVHTHPTCLPAMDARLTAAIDSFEVSMRAAIREAMDSVRDAIHKAMHPVLAEIRREIALIRRDLALGVDGDFDPASMCSKAAESIVVGHQNPHNGDGNPLRISSTIHDHSIPPLLSSSPMLRALANSAVKPHSNNSAASTVLFPESKTMISAPLLLHQHSFSDTTKTGHAVVLNLSIISATPDAKFSSLLTDNYGAYLKAKFGWVNWYLVGKFVKKYFYALHLFDDMSKRERANVHVLSIMSYHMVKSIPSWHIFHDERKLEVMTCKALSDRYINLSALRITGGAPVIVALSSQDGTILSLIGIASLEEWDAFNEVFRNCPSLLAMKATIKVLQLMGLLMTNNGMVGSNRVVQAACAIVDVIDTEVCELTLLNQKAAMVLQKLLSAAFSINSSSQICSDFRRKLENDFMLSLQSVVREGGKLQPIRPLPWYPENHADFSVLFTSNLDFQLVWDPGDASAKAVKLMLYLQCEDGKRMGSKPSCFCSRQCGGDWHHEAMPSLVYWLEVRWVRTWEPPHESQHKLHNDKGEKHMNNLFDIQRLLQKLVVSWYIRYCYFAQLPTNIVATCSKSMTFWMTWEILLSAIWVLSAASHALFIVRQVDGSVQLMFGNRETLLYEIEWYKESTSNEQLSCLAIQLHYSEFNLGTNNEINWAQEQKGACVIVWGDVDCIEVCDIREWPPTSPLDHKLGKIVLLLEESYLALGQAYEEDGQLHQALQGRKCMSQFELEDEVQDDLKRATREFTKVNNDTNKLSHILQLTGFSDKLNIVEQIVGTIRTVAPFIRDKQAIEKYNQFFILTLRTRLFLRGGQCYDLD